VMTGFEYTAGIGMLYEGLEEEGLEVMTNIRNRYRGNRRNPFDEAECGHHYARAMASWSSVLALSGFHFSGVENKIKFTDRPGSYFWSNGSAWGVCEVGEAEGAMKVDFTVLFGEINLNSFHIGSRPKHVFDSQVKMKENDHILLSF
jgi:non-lysosomal glucosylceramidase